MRNNANPVAKSTPVAAVSADACRPLSLREEALAAGVSPSTVHRRRAAAAKARNTLNPASAAPTVEDLVAQVASLRLLLEARVTPPAPANDTTPVPDPDPPIAGGRIPSPSPVRVSRDRRRFVLTSAQNNTYAHPGFLASLRIYAAEHDAEILISRFSYNKKAWAAGSTKGSEDLWYDPEIADYVCNESLELASGLVWCGELDILPTATDPLSGLDSYTRSASGIVPHAKVAMRSMATMKHEPPRFLYTTGTVTQRNYVQRKAGQKASFHHVFGALIVEVDLDGTWFVRQLLADDAGHFHDLDHLYTPTGVTRARVEAITWGDFHEEKADPIVAEACFGGTGSILESLRPREQHVHDLADFTARNHHNRGDAYFAATMLAAGKDRVEVDLAGCAVKLARIHRDWCQTVVVESNHDQAFRRWLGEADGHRDAPNARYWHYWNWKMFQAIERGEDLFVFEAAVREKLTPAAQAAKFLREDDSWVVCSEQGGGVQCGLHGHRGPNGSRGSPRAFRQIGVRVNSAHTHSAGITDGVYTAGVSGALDMGYNCGPSSWSHSYIVTYPSGKRAIITQHGSRWRGESVQAVTQTIRRAA